MASLCRLTDDLLAEILLRLPTLADVGRAATVCTAFRRAVADHAFLLRLRRVHRAPLLGFLSSTHFYPADPPHSSAPYAKALMQAADFSFSFVPSAQSATGRRFVMDARDGRVLLKHDGDYRELVVCDPLRRQYTLLPEIPQGDSTASPDRPTWNMRYREAFLIPADEEEAETSSFKVLYMEEWSPEPPAAFVFSSGTGQWSRLALAEVVTGILPPLYTMHRPTPCYVNGCFYWTFTTSDVHISFISEDIKKSNVDRLLVLNTRSMEFSTNNLPPPGPGYAFREHAIVEAGKGSIQRFTVHKSIHASRDSYISCAIGAVDDEGKNNMKWQPERTVLTLPSLHYYDLVGARDWCLLFHGSPSLNLLQSPSWDKSNMWGTSDVDFTFFCVELESMQIKRVCCRSLTANHAMPYTSFPPSLCPPSV